MCMQVLCMVAPVLRTAALSLLLAVASHACVDLETLLLFPTNTLPTSSPTCYFLFFAVVLSAHDYDIDGTVALGGQRPCLPAEAGQQLSRLAPLWCSPYFPHLLCEPCRAGARGRGGAPPAAVPHRMRQCGFSDGALSGCWTIHFLHCQGSSRLEAGIQPNFEMQAPAFGWWVVLVPLSTFHLLPPT